MQPPASDTAATLTSVSGAGDDRDVSEAVTSARPVHPYVHVVVVAVIAAVAVLAWLIVFEAVNKLLWENDVRHRRTRGCSRSSACRSRLLVGLLVKYRHAPTTLDESLLDSLSGDVTKIDWRALPINVVMAWASLFSGAVLGPEGGIGGIASKLAGAVQRQGRHPDGAALAARVLDARRPPTTGSSPTRCSRASSAPS